jgi:hypothetical protein
VNATTLKLLLALLWLIPGVGFLVLDLVTGERHGARVFGRDVPYAWVAIPVGLVNLARWYASRPPRVEPSSLHRRHGERRRAPEPPAEPDPNFRFDDPPTN